MIAASLYAHFTVDADGTARIEQILYEVLHLTGEHHHYA